MNWREYQALQEVAPLGDHFVSYLDEGQGHPVILLHGIPTWGFLWRDVMLALVTQFRVIVPDLLGFGYSDKSDRFDRSIAFQTEAIVRLLDRLGINGINVVAHDIGGGVALRLATLHPSRVDRLVLLNSVCYDSWPVEAMLQLGHPGAYKLMSGSTAGFLVKQMLKGGFATNPGREVLEGLVAPWSTEVGKRSLVRNASALNTNLTTEITALLPRIRIPTSILWGADDVFQPARYGRRLARDIPNARFEAVSGARHFVMWDARDLVIDRVLSFLRQ